MVDAIVREWIFQMEAAGFDTADIRVIAVVFYADDGLVAVRDPALLQDAFTLAHQPLRPRRLGNQQHQDQGDSVPSGQDPHLPVQ